MTPAGAFRASLRIREIAATSRAQIGPAKAGQGQVSSWPLVAIMPSRTFAGEPGKPLGAPCLRKGDEFQSTMGAGKMFTAEIEHAGEPSTISSVYRRICRPEGSGGRRRLELVRSTSGRARLLSGELLAKPRRVHPGAPRDHRISREEVGARARLSTDQGALELHRRPNRRAFRI